MDSENAKLANAVVAGACTLILMLALVSALFAVPIYFLWNWLIPDLLHLPRITLGQAWGLYLLCACLFKSGAPSWTQGNTNGKK